MSSLTLRRAAILAAALVTAACGRQGAAPAAAALPAAISVPTTDASARPMPRTLAVTASLVANQQSDVAANALGRVIKTFVERGDYVKEGAPLVQLDARTAQLSRTEADANMRNAQTAVELARSECARNEGLFKKGAVSQEEWDRLRSQCDTSVGAAEAAKARASLAEKTLADSTVRAPFSGMVSERFVSVGEYVQPPTRVVTMVDLDPLRLQMTINEADIGRVHQGQDVTFEVDAYPHEQFTGTVKYLDPSVRSATRDMVIEATVANGDHRLHPGMFATAKVVLPDEATVSVPAKALRKDASATRLFAVVNGLVEERLVQTGPEKDGYVAVLDGLKAGERVVADPGDQVKDGVPVK
jgi:membrane fusion protein (multidrug efflux system)